jgi:hypothetical protein
MFVVIVGLVGSGDVWGKCCILVMEFAMLFDGTVSTLF